MTAFHIRDTYCCHCHYIGLHKVDIPTPQNSHCLSGPLHSKPFCRRKRSAVDSYAYNTLPCGSVGIFNLITLLAHFFQEVCLTYTNWWWMFLGRIGTKPYFYPRPPTSTGCALISWCFLHDSCQRNSWWWDCIWSLLDKIKLPTRYHSILINNFH